MKPLFILGVDLGQAQDFTALCVLERMQKDTGRTERTYRARTKTYGYGGHLLQGQASNWEVHPVFENHYAARHLERLPIGIPYPVQVARIKELHDHLKVQERTAPLLVVD